MTLENFNYEADQDGLKATRLLDDQPQTNKNVEPKDRFENNGLLISLGFPNTVNVFDDIPVKSDSEKQSAKSLEETVDKALSDSQLSYGEFQEITNQFPDDEYHKWMKVWLKGLMQMPEIDGERKDFTKHAWDKTDPIFGKEEIRLTRLKNAIIQLDLLTDKVGQHVLKSRLPWPQMDEHIIPNTRPPHPLERDFYNCYLNQQYQPPVVDKFPIGGSDALDNDKWFQPDSKFSYVPTERFRSTSYDSMLLTTGIGQCAGLIALDNNSHRQFMGHVFPDQTRAIYTDSFKTKLKEEGIDINNGDFYIAQGRLDFYYTPFQVYELLVRTGVPKDHIYFVPARSRDESPKIIGEDIFVHDGKLSKTTLNTGKPLRKLLDELKRAN